MFIRGYRTNEECETTNDAHPAESGMGVQKLYDEILLYAKRASAAGIGGYSVRIHCRQLDSIKSTEGEIFRAAVVTDASVPSEIAAVEHHILCGPVLLSADR